MSSSDKIHFSEISFASMNIDNKKVSRILIVFKKSHKCEEGGAHLRVFVWHLLMNLKNNYLLKNCWSEPLKNIRIFIFTMLYLKKKIETPGDIIISHLCTKNLDDMIYSSWDIEWQTEIGNYESFFALLFPLKTQKIKILKKFKK